MLSKSRFCRRLHRIKHLLLTCFELLGDFWKAANNESIYIIDTFPLAACDNMRISRARRYRGEAFRGYQASKRRYFYGLKVHLMVTATGQPVEFFLTPDSVGDTTGLDCFVFDLPAGSRIFGDKAYNYYTMEDVLNDAELYLIPLRKKNSKRPPWMCFLQSHYRHTCRTSSVR